MMPLAAVELTRSRERPLLVTGPSLGTSVTTLRGRCARLFEDHFHVVVWDPPGHGLNSARAPERLSMGGLAAAVLDAVDEVLVARSQPGARFASTADSVGGAVGLQLLLNVPERLTTATLACTGAQIGDAAAWRDRGALVLGGGGIRAVESSRQRWFGPHFEARHPQVAQELIDALVNADPMGYAVVCDVLRAFDVRHRLHEITTPVLAIAGSANVHTPPSLVRELVAGAARSVRGACRSVTRHLRRRPPL